MKSVKKEDLGKSTFRLTVTVDWSTIKGRYDAAFEEIRKDLKAAGFRKGKVPKDIAQKHVKDEAVYKEVLNKLIPDMYQKAIAQENLKPVIQPRVKLVQAKPDTDWVIEFTLAQAPTLDLTDLKKIVSHVRAEAKKDDIWVPGKAKDEKDDKKKQEHRSRLLNSILNGLLNKLKVEISNLIVQAELDRRMTQLVDDVRKVGLTIESYLQSKSETIDTLRAKITKEIEDMYKLEFILEAVAAREKITVEKEDLEIALSQIKDENERKQAEKNSYMYASILRRQKTLDYLLSL